MVLTLATDYSELRGVLAFPAAVLMFLVSVLVALMVSKSKRGEAWWLVVVWGVFYPVAQGVASGMLERKHGVWLQTAGPTVVTALLLLWVTRSWVPLMGCLAGWLASSAAGPSLVRTEEEWLLAVPWNLCVGVSLLIWAWWERGARQSEQAVAEGAPNVCVRCGYDLKGLSGSVCPECGGEVKPAR